MRGRNGQRLEEVHLRRSFVKDGGHMLGKGSVEPGTGYSTASSQTIGHRETTEGPSKSDPVHKAQTSIAVFVHIGVG